MAKKDETGIKASHCKPSHEGVVISSEGVFEAGRNVWTSSQNSATNAWNWNSSQWNNNSKSNTNNYGVALCELFSQPELQLLQDLLVAYYDCRRNKRRKNSQLKFEQDLEDNIMELFNQVRTKTYEIGKSVAFCVTRPKLREVFAADFRDRIIHHYVMRKLEPLFEDVFIDDTYNCRKGKGVMYGAQRLAEKIKTLSCNYTQTVYIGKFDCKGFFTLIHKPTLLSKVKDFVMTNYHAYDKEVILWLLEKIILHHPETNCIKHSPDWLFARLSKEKSLFTCDKDYGLPIGNLPSQFLANFMLTDFDNYMVKQFGEGYGRYTDDFFVISKDKRKVLEIITPAKLVLASVKVTLHPNKIYCQDCFKGVTFAGITIKPHRTYIGHRLKNNFFQCVSELNSINHTNENRHKAMSRMNSYLGFCRNHATYNIRKQCVLAFLGCWHEFYTNSNYDWVKLKAQYNNKKYLRKMIRVTKDASTYLPMKKINDKRYRINFDKVEIEETSLATYSIHDYFDKPSTEQMQKEVISLTQQRYVNEGLEPPKAEDIDVSDYVID